MPNFFGKCSRMNIVIRADAAAHIGAGHLMRCLALADEVAAQGLTVDFVTRSDEQPWGELLRMHGHRVFRLPSNIEHWTQDLDATRQTLADHACDWLVVDHYSLAQEWETGMRSHARHILAIDDISRTHDCDVLLDQNVIDDKLAYAASTPAGCRRLLGPYYALLRSEFAAPPQRSDLPAGPVRNVVIAFGGSDPTGETGKAIEAFELSRLPGARAQVVVGAANPRAEELRQRYGHVPSLDFHVQPERISELLSAADIAIGAGGISTWERARLGVPSIVISVADNQRSLAEQLAVRGCHCYLGGGEVSVKALADSLVTLAMNPFLRAAFSRSSRALCDGHGTRRVAAVLRSSSIVLRPATISDSDSLYSWRNAETVRRHSGSPDPISRSEHQRWLQEVLADDTRHLLIGADAQGAVGVIRYDVCGASAEVSIYLVLERMGQGLGTALLSAGQAWLVANVPGVREVTARVRHENVASMAMFEASGYELCERKYRLSLQKGLS